MLKRILIFVFALLCAFSFAREAFAAEAPDQYTAAASVNEILYKETVTFEITTPEQASIVKGYVGGKLSAEATLADSGAGVKVWSAVIPFKKVGKSNVTFKAYSEKGKVLKQFPDAPIVITVKHLPPVTESPIMVDSDRAELLGTPPENCGLKQKEHGFYFGSTLGSLKKIKSNKIIRGKANKLVTGLLPNKTYYCRAYTVTSGGTVYGRTIFFTTPRQTTPAAEDAVFENTDDRYSYLFGSTDRYYKIQRPPYGFASSSEASKQMVNIKVPVWKIRRGKRVSGTMALTINYKLEENVKAIFQEIYELDMQFPVMALKGYGYRRIVGPGLTGSSIMSHHSFGAAIDINKPYNLFYRYRDKRNKKSPYYIPQDVIDIFEKYGWAWGGDFKEGFDTMHFQYLGLDLTEQR